MSDPVPEPSVTVCAVRETAPGEQRVALVPESVPVLARARVHVLVESGAGAGACFPDGAYERAGAEVVSRNEAISLAGVIACVGMPAPDLITGLRAGQTVIGMLRPLVEKDLVRRLATAGVTAISLDGLPRTVSRAQSMDALTSQANVAGYKAVLVAAGNFGRFFPMLITEAGWVVLSVGGVGGMAAGLVMARRVKMTDVPRVFFAIHPVAGRMPGHMNVLLAEANVPYTDLKEMDAANPEFATADVALVLGANDVTNPAARRPGNPVSGMPILNVDQAKNVIVIKRSMGHGYAGIDNELYADPKTGMFFSDAKAGLAEIIASVKALVAS